MLLVRRILGHIDEPRSAGRPADSLPLDSTDATKRRLRVTTREGVDVALDLERGAYLFAGAVLDDDGERLIVVERPPEEALVVWFSPALDRASLVERAARIGHALGNQHVPVELEDGKLRAPITTSREFVEESIARFGLDGIEHRFADVPLGRDRPLERPGSRRCCDPSRSWLVTSSTSCSRCSSSTPPVSSTAPRWRGHTTSPNSAMPTSCGRSTVA